MFGWFQSLMPRENRFFALFNDHAELLVQGADALREVLKGGAGVAEACRKVMELENQADAVTRDVLLLVRRSFITPFDRSDIKDLIDALDDTIDQMQKTAKAVLLFEVDTMESEMADMGEKICQSSLLTRDAVRLLASIKDGSAKINTITEKIIRLEDEADTLNDRGIKSLFVRHRNGNAMDYLVGVEIFDHLEKVMDRFEDVAARIAGIVIEHM